MKKIAICIPTYKRAKMVSEICVKIADTIEKEAFDVYVYDSTPDRSTEEALYEVLQENDHFFYVKVPPEIHSSKKLYDIYKNGKIQSLYDYLWILPDYMFFTKEIVQAVLTKAEENWDMLMLDYYDPEKVGDRLYSDAKQIFSEYAWSMVQYGLVLLHCNRVLKNVDWQTLESKYLCENCYNFSHVTMYFERMIQIPEFKFFHFSVERRMVYISKYRREYGDFDSILRIWGYRWYKSLYALPVYYNRQKKTAIKRFCRNTGMLDEKNVATLRVRNVLNRKTFGEYRKQWHLVSTVPPILVWFIVYMPSPFAEGIARFGSVKGWFLRPFVLLHFYHFCKKCKKIYVYGAGVLAQNYADFLEKNGISFEGFLVSNSDSNEKMLKRHKVSELLAVPYETGMGIIIALNEKNKNEVLPLLHENGYREIFRTNILTPFYRF